MTAIREATHTMHEAGGNTYWAYDFGCHRSIEAILAIFNRAGPWQWQLRDSSTYGNYAASRPVPGVSLRLIEYPQLRIGGLRDKGFKALLEIGAASPATQSEVDDVIRGLLQKIDATDVTAVDAYD